MHPVTIIIMNLYSYLDSFALTFRQWAWWFEESPLVPQIIANSFYGLAEAIEELCASLLLHWADLYAWESRIEEMLNAVWELDVDTFNGVYLQWLNVHSFRLVFLVLEHIAPEVRRLLLGDDVTDTSRWAHWVMQFAGFLQNPGGQIVTWLIIWNESLFDLLHNPDQWLADKLETIELESPAWYDDPLTWGWNAILSLSEDVFRGIAEPFMKTSEHILRYLFEGVW